MQMWRLASLVSWLILLSVQVLPACAQVSENFTIIENWYSDTSCGSESAEPVKLQKLLAAPDRYLGRCVRTSGYVRAPALYASRKEARAHVIGQVGPEDIRALGFYQGTTPPDALKKAEGRKATLTGVVGLCADLRTEAAMITGYCHYTDGAMIALTSVSD